MNTTRPAIVTILGHVDHGKTSLLDYIRKANVASKEHGGITQHIGAYQAIHNGQLITFIDTPGHSAFEKMRSRGAQVADIAVLVVAADDGLMPQTIEAIKHIKAAKSAMIVAVNKIDLPDINLEVQLQKIKKQLSDHEILVEEYGGDVPIVPLSAKTGDGVDKLLEMILLIGEMSELVGDPDVLASGVVIEAKQDKFRGPVTTILIKDGTLSKGETMMVGGVKGKARGMFDYNGAPIENAGPSTPVEVLGLEEVPAVGALMGEVATVRDAKPTQSLIEKLRNEDAEILAVVVRADNQGSLEAIEEALSKFNEEGEHLKIVASGTGEINDGDIKSAVSGKGIVLGFNTKVANSAAKLADHDKVLIRTYNVIYELIDEMKDVVEGMLKIDQLDEVFGTATILAEFPFGKTDRIAGCRVLDGSIAKGPKVRVVRGRINGDTGEVEGEVEVIGEGKIRSLKKGREEVPSISKGGECGIMFDTEIDWHVGDIVQTYRIL